MAILSTPTQSEGRCIVVFSTKGGVGKSILTANLGLALAQLTRSPVCLLDLDVTAAGDLSRMMRLTQRQVLMNYAKDLRQQGQSIILPLDQLAVKYGPPGQEVDVIQALSHPSQGRELEPSMIQSALKFLKTRYPYVIVDSKVLTDPLIAALDEANLILLAMTPDIVSLYQTKWAVSTIESYLLPQELIKGVLNRAESRGGVGSKDARQAVPCEIIAEIPSDGKAMGSAINQGVPVFSLFRQSKVAEAFQKLAETLHTTPGVFLSHQRIHQYRVAKGQTAGAPGPAAAPGAPAPKESRADDILNPAQQEAYIALKRRIHSRLVDELNLKKVDLAVLTNPERMKEMRQQCEQVIAKLLMQELGGAIAVREDRARFVKEVSDEALGLGPLEDLLEDKTINDILVNNKDQVYVERFGKLEMTDKKFVSDEQVRAIIERIVAPLGRRIDESTPMVDARLADGSRVNAIIPPLSLKGPTLSIRKFARERLEGEDLIRMNSLTAGMATFIQASVRVRKNIIISGGTGSGKTTFLNIVSNYIPDNERIVTIEDAAELKLAQTHWVSLESRPANVEGKGSVTIRDLFRNVLRMRPDRIVIGECRGAETLDMLQAMNTGHDGSLTTIHANSPKDVISRLDSMVLMSSVDLPITAIREMVVSAVDLIIHTARLTDGTRKVLSISEIIGLEHGSEVILRNLFVFNQVGTDPATGKVIGDFMATGEKPSYFRELQVKGLGVDESIFTPSNGNKPQEPNAPLTRPFEPLRHDLS